MLRGMLRVGRAALVSAVIGSSLILAAPEAAAVDVGLTATSLVTGLDNPWDLTFTPDGSMLYNQRAGVLSVRLTDGTTRSVAADFRDLYVAGETGLMGMVVDPDYSTNRRLYTCQGYQNGTVTDIRVIKWQVRADYSAAIRDGNPIVSGIQITGGRHGGCRLRFDNRNLLYISTGDAAIGTNPQDLTSLNGKVLRVTRTGAAAPGNPFASSPNAKTRLIFTYGHRNVQGLSLRPGTNEMWSVEQGTDADDEVNHLIAGKNYGYNPVPGYNESVPMTDMSLPFAQPAVFTTGFPTLALSGGTWLSGAEWGRWNGAFVAAALKATSVRVLTIAGTDNLARVENPPELLGTYGRLRTPQLGPDGALYLTTSNGNGADQILKVTPGVKAGDARCQGNGVEPASPVGAVTANGVTSAFVVGTNQALYYRSMEPGSGYRTLGGIVRYGPAAVSWDGSRTDLFVVGSDGRLNHRWGVGDRWPVEWENLGGFLTSSPAAISFSPGTLDVFARGGDNARGRSDGPVVRGLAGAASAAR